MIAQAGVIGRAEELAAIGEFLESVAEGSSALVLEGAPGVGKTTLWRCGLARARELGFRVLTASPAKVETKFSLSTLGDLLGGVLGDVLPALSEPQRRALQVALLLEESDGRTTDPRTLGVAVLGGLTKLSDSGPVLLAIDDVQWVDSASATVLGFALRRLESGRVGVLLAERLDDGVRSAERVQLHGFEQADALRRLPVGPLSLGALHHLLHDRLGLVFARPRLRRLHALCAGNPFYGLELGRAVERGMIDLERGETLPGALWTLVGARVALLPPETRSALLAVAAVSQPTCELLARAAGEDVMTKLGPALASEVIELDGDRIRFTHPLLASGVYGAADASERRVLHRRLAALVPDIEERARHLALASDGPDEEVAAVLDEAAIDAHRRGVVDAAAELSQLARRFTPEDRGAAWHERTVRAASYAFEVGESERARELLEEALATASPGPQRAQALEVLGDIEEYSGDRRRAVALYRLGLDEPDLDPVRRAGLEEGIAITLLLLREDLPRAAEHARSAVSSAGGVNARSTLSMALGTLGMIDALLGREGWQATVRAGIDVEPDVEPARITERAPMALAVALIWVDEVEEARALLCSLLEGAYERAEESGVPWILAQLALLEFQAGRWEEAIEHADDAIAVALQTSQDPQRLFALGVRALVHAWQGDAEGARADAEAVLGPAEDRGVMIATILTLSALGQLELVQGRPEAVDRLLEPLDARLERGGVREPGSTRFITDQIEALVGLGRLAEAEALLARVEGRAQRLDRASVLATCLRCRGMLAAARGDLDGALAALEQALSQHDRVPIPHERARTLLALGSTLRRGRMKRRARAALDEARAIFAGLGARAWCERARAEAARIGGRAPASDELTPSERRVAALVAEGRSNKEVAAALVVTVKTVEAHLSRIYAKLRVRSRAELATRFARERIGEEAGKP